MTARGFWFCIPTGAMLLSCTNPSTHVFLANLYDATNNCLNPSASTDVVDGPAPTVLCASVCLTDPQGNIYVTTMCAPYPPEDTVVVQDASAGTPCSAAFAAESQALVCGASSDAGMDGSGSAEGGDAPCGLDGDDDGASGDDAAADSPGDTSQGADSSGE